jgi:hypothetical protein
LRAKEPRRDRRKDKFKRTEVAEDVMHASQKETAGLKTPQVQTPNGQLAGLAATETTGDALALTLEIIKGLGAYPE